MDMALNEIIGFISQVGFPIVVTCYLLHRDSTIIKDLTKATENNTDALTRLIDYMHMKDGGI